MKRREYTAEGAVALAAAICELARKDAQRGIPSAAAWLADLATVRPSRYRLTPDAPHERPRGESRASRLIALARAAGWPERSIFGQELERLAFEAGGLTYLSARNTLASAKRKAEAEAEPVRRAA